MANNQINNEYVQKGYLKAYLANRGIKVVDYDEWERLCDCIDDAKAADVRENVRGEWTLVTDRYGANGEYVWKCSSCNKMTICKGDFCPNCGCEMER